MEGGGLTTCGSSIFILKSHGGHLLRAPFYQATFILYHLLVNWGLDC